MSQLNVTEQRNFLQYLLETRAADVARSKGAGLFLPELRAAYAAFVALDETRDAVDPVPAAALAAAARVQTEQRQLILSLADVVERTVVDGATTAEKLRDLVAVDAQNTYLRRAALARALSARIAVVEPVVAALPAGLGGLLSNALTAYADAGRDLDRLVQQRAEAIRRGDTGPSIATRLAQTSILLRQLRDLIRLELRNDPTLPRNLEARLFDYQDELAAGARSRRNARKAHSVAREVDHPVAVERAEHAAG